MLDCPTGKHYKTGASLCFRNGPFSYRRHICAAEGIMEHITMIIASYTDLDRITVVLESL